MIVYYDTGRLEVYEGDVLFSNKDQDVNLINKNIVISDATIFITHCTPYLLIREDFPIQQLLAWGLKLPETYIDRQLNIRNSKGEIVFAGPSNIN